MQRERRVNRKKSFAILRGSRRCRGSLATVLAGTRACSGRLLARMLLTAFTTFTALTAFHHRRHRRRG